MPGFDALFSLYRMLYLTQNCQSDERYATHLTAIENVAKYLHKIQLPTEDNMEARERVAFANHASGAGVIRTFCSTTAEHSSNMQ